MLALVFALLAFQIPPTPTKEVADYAGVLAPADAAALEAQLRGTGIVVATFRSLEGEDAAEITNRIFEKWGPYRHKGQDDGVLVALFVDDRKWQIEVGYGAESILTDAQAAIVGRETLVPRLRQGDYSGGLQATATRLKDILDRKAAAPQVPRSPVARRGRSLLPILFIIIFIILSSRRRGVLGSRGFSVLPWWWWFGGGGGGWGGGGGGGWGGGGDGGGGFGGGRSGGGGAGGSW